MCIAESLMYCAARIAAAIIGAKSAFIAKIAKYNAICKLIMRKIMQKRLTIISYYDSLNIANWTAGGPNKAVRLSIAAKYFKVIFCSFGGLWFLKYQKARRLIKK